MTTPISKAKGERLTDQFVDAVETVGWHGDGRGGFGLRLRVQKSKHGHLCKSWVQRIKIGGKTYNRGLGTYPVVTLAEARAAALENQRQIKYGSGHELVQAADRAKTPTFKSLVPKVIELRIVRSADAYKAQRQWENTIIENPPAVLDMPVGEITVADVRAVVAPYILNHGNPTSGDVRKAADLRQRMRHLFAYAIVEGYRTDNPIDGLDTTLPQPKIEAPRQRSAHYSAAPKLYRAICDTTDRAESLRLLLRFVMLTGSRASEGRELVLSEIEQDKALWTLPAARAKTGKEQKMPLSSETMEVLYRADELAGGIGVSFDDMGLAFPNNRGKSYSTEAMRNLVVDASGGEVTTHGLRSMFRTWAAENRTDVPREIAEACLSHDTRSEVEARYNRADYIEAKRDLLQSWADFLTGEKSA
ncbi:MAG: tyrosine-type recombinase/integrase [Gammaproteobacteria bacterium]|nr:tyrosine-type recombinase/integrase [Gammaproteobacteria bacterium]